jgi:hypothetical protein
MAPLFVVDLPRTEFLDLGTAVWRDRAGYPATFGRVEATPQKLRYRLLGGQIMKIKIAKLLSSLLFLLAILLLPWLRAEAQTSRASSRITQAVDENNLAVLKGNVNPLARAEFDQGAVNDGQPLHRMLLLLQRGPDQEAALQNLLDDQQNKSSANYHAWLTPAQFGQQFGPSDADIQMVTNWLQSHGFQITNVTAGRTLIEFSGNAAQVRSAFHTEIHKYIVNGEARMANASDPEIPAALAPVVAGPVSLNNFPRKSYSRILGQFRRIIGKPGLQPLFTFPDPFSGTTFYGLGPGDFATIYNSKPLIASGNDGTGQTIAIVGETNINVQDVQQFRQMFGLPANFDATNVILNGEDPGITSTGEEGEADLDVEWSGAVAPGATVKFVVSASTAASAGIDLSALYIVEHNLAGAMSESYGQCETGLGTAGNAFYSQLWEQAAAQGITVILSAGDGGSAGCDDFNSEEVATHGLAVSGLASTPFNVSVGGTDFDEVNTWGTYWNGSNDATGTSARSYIPEIPWNQNCAQISLTGCGASAPNGSLDIVAGSGGPSSVYPKPKWQIGVAGMPNDSHRDQPDISLFASPGFNGTGYVYCQSDQTISGLQECDMNNVTVGLLDFGIVGGTSASAPSFAGIMALVNQYEASHGGTNRQGNANYTLYALANKAGASCASSKTESTACVFNDVTKGNSTLPTGLPGVGTNSVPCKGGTLNCSSALPANNGVLVDPNHTSTEAWTATAGYDMTTGLGTLNVNNLATSWAGVSTISTTTTLTLSPTTGITHGTSENVTVGITVKPNSGTGVPAGDVSLIATLSGGATQGLDHFTLASGAIAGATTKSLPGGTYSVSAHYAGDGTNAPSDSTPVQVTVGKESSQAFIVVPTFDSSGNQLSGNATSFVYGTQFIGRIYVTDKNAAASAGGPPNPVCSQENLLTCPSGTVTLTDNGTPLNQGTFHLNSAGYTRDLAATPATFTGGTHKLVAAYSGDGSYTSSMGTDIVTVTPAPTTTEYDSTNFYAIVGQPFSFTFVSIGSVQQGVDPSGTFVFSDNGTPLTGPVNTSAPGGHSIVGSAFETFTAPGKHMISATYSGDASYAPSSSTSPLTVTVQYLDSLTVSANPTTVNYGSPVTITAKVTTSHLTPALAGTFAFNPASAPVTTNLSTDGQGNQVITGTMTFVPNYSESIDVGYGGDANYIDGDTNVFVNVNIPDFSLSVPNTPFTVPVGQPGSLQIGIAPATNMSSPVILTCGGNLPVGYACSFQPSTVNLAGGVTGTSVLSLSLSASSNTVRPNAIRQKRAGLGVLSTGSGTDPFLRIGVSSGLAALLLLVWPVKKKRLRSAIALGTACAICLAIGCGGGGSIVGGGGGGGPVGPFATTTTISTNMATTAQASPLVWTANVSGKGSPTGIVNFYANGSWFGQASLIQGVATLNTSLPFPGVYSITAQYSGDGNNVASTSTGVSEGITGTTVMQINGQTSAVFHSANVTVTLQ